MDLSTLIAVGTILVVLFYVLLSSSGREWFTAAGAAGSASLPVQYLWNPGEDSPIDQIPDGPTDVLIPTTLGTDASGNPFLLDPGAVKTIQARGMTVTAQVDAPATADLEGEMVTAINTAGLDGVCLLVSDPDPSIATITALRKGMGTNIRLGALLAPGDATNKLWSGWIAAMPTLLDTVTIQTWGAGWGSWDYHQDLTALGKVGWKPGQVLLGILGGMDPTGQTTTPEKAASMRHDARLLGLGGVALYGESGYPDGTFLQVLLGKQQTDASGNGSSSS